MSKLFEDLVKRRGFSEAYLRPKYENLAEPFLLPDMRKAVERIKQARERGEKVIVYGDYDADGVTASTVMNEILKWAGVEVAETMLPDRFKDGYGMSKKVVQEAERTGVTLVITVDCGSANGEVIEELKKRGVETIVTDHHECPEKLPEAVAVVNPKRKDAYKQVENLEEVAEKLVELRDLAGVGVAFMVARALVEEGLIPEGQEKWMLDLVLIGTICDSMRMTETNRILCYFGMKVFAKTRRVGLKELFRSAMTKKIDSETIGFQIWPRFNAAGRMASPEVALKLLTAGRKAEAAKLANQLEGFNTQRRTQQLAAMKEFKERGVGKDKVLIVTGDWHEGVLGIIAGKLMEDYRRPAFVMTRVKTDDGEIFKGSGRSFGDFNLAEALRACAEEIIGGGGHAGAAGVKVSPEKLEEFRAKINEYYDSLKLGDQEKFFERRADLDLWGLGGLDLDFMQELRTLEPFGVGNEVPVFGLREMLVLDKKLMGAENQHMRMMVRGEDGKLLKLVAFGVPEEWKRIEQGQRADLLVNVEENEWNGLKSVEGRILELRGC